MDTKILQEIGLTEGETKVYLSLLKLGETKTGQLANDAGVSSSKVYKILDRLKKKGLVGHAIKGKIQYFSAMKPQRIIDYLSEKEKELKEKKEIVEKLIPQLEIQQQLSKAKSDSVLYEGWPAIANFFRGILDENKEGDSYCVIGVHYEDIPGLRAFFNNYHQQRADKKIYLKMLVNNNVKEVVKTTLIYSEVKYLPPYIITPMQIVICKNKTFIIVWKKDPIAFLIENKEATQSFQVYFDTFWDIAKDKIKEF